MGGPTYNRTAVPYSGIRHTPQSFTKNRIDRWKYRAHYKAPSSPAAPSIGTIKPFSRSGSVLGEILRVQYRQRGHRLASDMVNFLFFGGSFR